MINKNSKHTHTTTFTDNVHSTKPLRHRQPDTLSVSFRARALRPKMGKSLNKRSIFMVNINKSTPNQHTWNRARH